MLISLGGRIPLLPSLLSFSLDLTQINWTELISGSRLVFRLVPLALGSGLGWGEERRRFRTGGLSLVSPNEDKLGQIGRGRSSAGSDRP